MNSTPVTKEQQVVMPMYTAPEDTKLSGMDWFVYLVTILWVVAGIVGFIVSIMCFGKSGTIAQQIVGLLLAVFFGPFYWLYYVSVRSYCKPSKMTR